jgi:hypothetical protein
MEAVAAPSWAEMVIWPVMPTSAAEGVPANSPVLASTLAHEGCPAIENVTVPPLVATLGLKTYRLPAITRVAGVPVSEIVGAGGVDEGDVGAGLLDEGEVPLPEDAPAVTAAP